MPKIKTKTEKLEIKLLNILKDITQEQYPGTLTKWNSTNNLQDKLDFIFNLVHDLEKIDQKDENKTRAKKLKKSWNRYARSILNSDIELNGPDNIPYDERDLLIHNINNFRSATDKNTAIKLHTEDESIIFKYLTKKQLAEDVKKHNDSQNKQKEYIELKSTYDFLYGAREKIKNLNNQANNLKNSVKKQKAKKQELIKKIRKYKKLHEISKAKDVKKTLDDLIKKNRIKTLDMAEHNEKIKKITIETTDNIEKERLQKKEYIERSTNKRKNSKLKKRLTLPTYIPTLLTPCSEASINAFFLRNGALSKRLLSAGSCLTLNTALFGCATKPAIKEFLGYDHYFQINENTINQTQPITNTPIIKAKKQSNLMKGITPAQFLIIAGLEVSTLFSFLGLTITATSALFPPAVVVIAAICTAIAVSMLVYPDLKEAVKNITFSNFKNIPQNISKNIYDEYNKISKKWKEQKTKTDKFKLVFWHLYLALAYTSAIALSLIAGVAYTILYKESLPNGLNVMFGTFDLTMHLAKTLSIVFSITSSIAWTPFNIQALKSCLVELPGKIGNNIYKKLPSTQGLSWGSAAYSVATAIPRVALGVVIFSTLAAMIAFNAIGQAGGVVKGISFLSVSILKVALGISCAASNLISPVNEITDSKTIKQASKEDAIKKTITNFLKLDTQDNTQSPADQALIQSA